LSRGRRSPRVGDLQHQRVRTGARRCGTPSAGRCARRAA
jgi:hypothetical protein